MSGSYKDKTAREGKGKVQADIDTDAGPGKRSKDHRNCLQKRGGRATSGRDHRPTFQSAVCSHPPLASLGLFEVATMC
jgi:hypothetical protein